MDKRKQIIELIKEDSWHNIPVENTVDKIFSILGIEREKQVLSLGDVVQRYSLIQIQSAFTGEMLDTWYRPDMMLFVERWVLEKGKVVDKFRILPNTNDISKIGHIDFTKHYYNNFEDAVKNMIELNVPQH